MSYYKKLLFVPCLKNETNFVGYCFPADPNSCPTCADPLVLFGDVQTNSSKDQGFFGATGVPGQVITATQWSVHGAQHGQLGSPFTKTLATGAVNFPISAFPPGSGNNGPWVSCTVFQDYDAFLSEEYTDAEALANATTTDASGAVAQNLPRQLNLDDQFTGMFTSVDFDLNCSNLALGGTYTVSVIFWNTTKNTKTTKSYGFIADSTTHTISDSIPTPDAGDSVEVMEPSINFAP